MVVNDILLKAISWTLVHSIWQGFLLAFFAGLVILLTKKSTSALRYNVLAVLFLVFLIGTGLTFQYEFQTENTETITRLNLPVQELQFQFGQGGTTILYGDYSQIIIDFLNQNANLIVLIWFVIFCIRCFGIFGSLSHIYRIRNYKTQQPSEFWQHKITELSARIQFHKTIILLESRLVKVPSVTGFFKPMILIPAGLLTQLPQDQIEAILLHELAHIRRKDYVINILQRFAEILFFFNPGLLWVSSILHDERENCCDDIAIAASESKAKFVHALVSFEEYNLKNNALVMGFGGSKNHLLNRAKRIIYNNNKTLNAVEKTILSFSIVAVSIIMVACANNKMNEQHPVSNGPEKNFVDKANAEADALVAQSNAEADLLVQKADAEASQADVEAAEADREAAKATAEAKLADAELKRIESEAKKNKAEIITVQPTDKARPADQSNFKTITKTTTSTTTTDDKPSSVVHVKTGITGTNLPEKIEVDQLTKSIISDLISENIIKTNHNLSYKLSDKELIVNNVVQPISVKNKFSRKYVKTKDISIVYNYVISDKTNN